MFDSLSSRGNQSAVDKLIKMATGTKAPTQAEEERPAPESHEQPQQQAAAAAVIEQPPAAEPWREAPTEPPVEAAPAPESSVNEAPAEPRPQVSDLLKSLAKAPGPVAVEPKNGHPFHEPPVEAAAPGPVGADPPPAEPLVEFAAEAAPVEEHAAPPAPEPVQAAEPPVDDRPFYEPPPAEPPVEAAAPEPVVAAPPAPEPVVVEPPAPAPVAAEPAPAPVVEEVKPEATPAETAAPVEAAAAAPEAEKPAVEKPEGSGEVKEAASGNAPKEASKAAAGRDEKTARAGGKDDEPFNLEKFRQRQAERRQRRGADIFPAPDETTFLRSRYRDYQRDEVTEEELKTLSRDPMWKTLVQFKGWLPVVSRVLPLLDLAGKRASSGNSEEIKDSVDGLLISNRDMRTTLQNQTVELKRVEEEITRLREASDKNAFEQSAISEDVRGIQRLMKNAFLYMGILLGLMVVAVGYMAFLVFTYLNHPMH